MKFGASWKTTVSGLLSLIVTGGAYLTLAPPPGFSTKQMGWTTFVLGLAKVYMSLIQKDGQGSPPPGSTTTVTTRPIPATDSAPAVPATTTTVVTK